MEFLYRYAVLTVLKTFINSTSHRRLFRSFCRYDAEVRGSFFLGGGGGGECCAERQGYWLPPFRKKEGLHVKMLRSPGEKNDKNISSEIRRTTEPSFEKSVAEFPPPQKKPHNIWSSHIALFLKGQFKIMCRPFLNFEYYSYTYAYWTVHHLDIWIKVDQ